MGKQTVGGILVGNYLDCNNCRYYLSRDNDICKQLVRLAMKKIVGRITVCGILVEK